MRCCEPQEVRRGVPTEVTLEGERRSEGEERQDSAGGGLCKVPVAGSMARGRDGEKAGAQAQDLIRFAFQTAVLSPAVEN